MTDSRIAGLSYTGLPSTDAAQNLRSLDPGFRVGSGTQIAQTPTTIKAKEVWVNPKNRMTPAQEKNSAKVEKMLKDWAAAKAANPNNLNNILGMNSDKAVRELGTDDLARWVVVRVNDDITVDLMTEACGVTYEDARDGIELVEMQGVSIPFAGAELMLK